MAQFRPKTKKELNEAPPVIFEGEEGATLDSIGGKRIKDIPYVQLRGCSHGGVDIFIKEDVLQRVP